MRNAFMDPSWSGDLQFIIRWLTIHCHMMWLTPPLKLPPWLEVLLIWKLDSLWPLQIPAPASMASVSSPSLISASTANSENVDLTDPTVRQFVGTLLGGSRKWYVLSSQFIWIFMTILLSKCCNKESSDGNSSDKGYRDYGRHFARVGTPYTKIGVLVEYGVIRELADSDDERDISVT